MRIYQDYKTTLILSDKKAGQPTIARNINFKCVQVISFLCSHVILHDKL